MTSAAIQTFSPEQLAERRKTLGASEIPVVTGHIKFKSPLVLWAEKRGLVPPFEGNEFTEWGNRLEPVIREKYAEVVGLRVEKGETVICTRESWRSCTPDSIVFDANGVAVRGHEIKCRGEFRAEEWGEPGTDQVPADVAIQAHWSMDVTGLRQWDITPLIGGNRFGVYTVFYDADIARSLTEIGRAFWKHVVDGTEPPIDASEATTEFLLRRFPSNNEVLRQATEEEEKLIRDILAVRADKKALEESEAAIGNLLRQAIGENAGIMSRSGKATWKQPQGHTVAWATVAQKMADTLGATKLLNELVNANAKPMSRRFLPSELSKKERGL